MSEPKTVEKIDCNSYRTHFNTRVYSPLAVKKAAYKFAAHFATIFTTNPTGDNSSLIAELHFAPTAPEQDRPALIQAFLNEVLDQDLRETIARETEATRNLILAEAFSKTSLLHEES